MRYLAITLVASTLFLASCSSDEPDGPTGTLSPEQEIESLLGTDLDLPSHSPIADADMLEVDFNCNYDSSIGFAYVEGEVANISGQRLENVQAVGTWYTSDRTFVTSDSALVDYDPLLPGQTSPFKIISRYNPAMASCKVGFQELLGDTIPARRR